MRMIRLGTIGIVVSGYPTDETVTCVRVGGT
jgi:hypothetical protein